MKKKLFALLMGASLALAACGGGGEDEAVNDTAGAGDPEKIYNQKCSGCHGGELQGGAGPELAHIGSKYSQEDIEGIIENGKGAMPKGLLTGEDASAVAEWLAGKK